MDTNSVYGDQRSVSHVYADNGTFEITRTATDGDGTYAFVGPFKVSVHNSAPIINELIVPRPRLSVNGRLDPLTPAIGVEKVRDHLRPLYGKYGKEADCRIDLFEAAHVELPRMRKLILEWMDRYLTTSGSAG